MSPLATAAALTTRAALADIFLACNNSIKKLNQSTVVLSSHESSWDSSIAAIISNFFNTKFCQLAAQKVLRQAPYLDKFGFKSLDENADAYERRSQLETICKSLQASEPFHFWVMPSQGQWPTHSDTKYTGVGHTLSRFMGADINFMVCQISYRILGQRRPTAFVYFEQIERPNLRSTKIGNQLKQANRRGDSYFYSRLPIVSMMPERRSVCVGGVTIRLASILKAVRPAIEHPEKKFLQLGGRIFASHLKPEEQRKALAALEYRFGLNIANSILDIQQYDS